MIQLINKKIRNRKGFTLIELIVVIAILAILGAIAVPRLQGFRGQAQVAAQQQNARIVKNAAELYFASNNGKAAHVVVTPAIAVGDDLTTFDVAKWLPLLRTANMIDTGVSVTSLSVDANGVATVTP